MIGRRGKKVTERSKVSPGRIVSGILLIVTSGTGSPSERIETSEIRRGIFAVVVFVRGKVTVRGNADRR